MSHIFVSYSRKDNCAENDFFVSHFVDSLWRSKFNVWIDKRNIDPGDKWEQAIDRAIRDSAGMIIILSPDSVKSEYVNIEMRIALEAGVKIYPYMYRTVDIPAGIAAYNALFHTDANAFDTLVKGLLKDAQSAYLHDSAILEKGLIGTKLKFSEAQREAKGCLSFKIKVGTLYVDLVGLPLKPTRYCTTYLIGRADDTLEYQPIVQIGLQMTQEYPYNDFPKDIARHFITKDQPDFNLRLLLIRGPFKVAPDEDRNRLEYGLDADSPQEWSDALNAVHQSLDVYRRQGEDDRPDIQLFALAPAVLSYRLGADFRDFQGVELYHYVREQQRYAHVMGNLSK